MTDKRIDKLVKLWSLIRDQDDGDAELDKLVALSMQTGYDLGRLTTQK